MNTSDQPATHRHTDDPLPDPEPAAPSLPAPDSGVFHHSPATPQPQSSNAPKSEAQS